MMNLLWTLLVMAAGGAAAAAETIDIELTAADPNAAVSEGILCFVDEVDISRNGNAWDQIVEKGESLLLKGENGYDRECHDIFLWTKYKNRTVIFEDKLSLQKRIGRFSAQSHPDAICDGDIIYGIWFGTSSHPEKLKKDKKRKRSMEFAKEESLRKRQKRNEERKEDHDLDRQRERNHNRVSVDNIQNQQNEEIDNLSNADSLQQKKIDKVNTHSPFTTTPSSEHFEFRETETSPLNRSSMGSYYEFEGEDVSAH